jgi:hypothetical protein
MTTLALYRDKITDEQDAAIRECIVALVRDEDCPDAHAVACAERNRIHERYLESCKYPEPSRLALDVAEAICAFCVFDTGRAWDSLLSAERQWE